LWQVAWLLFGVASCGKSPGDVSLSRNEDDDAPLVPVPAEDGPFLASTAHATPIRKSPERGAKITGYLHAGARVARAAEAFGRDDCEGGWYPVRPEGFVCLDEGATLDLEHPTLAAMAIQPLLDAPMPYTYARTKANTDLFEVDSEHEGRVRTAGKISSQSGLAVVGSWQATDSAGNQRSLAMMTNGWFVDTAEIERAKHSDFQGLTLDDKTQLPVAFVVKRGVAAWGLGNAGAERKDELEYQQKLPLSGRFRTVGDDEYWEVGEDIWVRHQDVTLVRLRESFPGFATSGRRWLDISISTGTLVAYEGRRPVFTTLVSIGKDRLGEGLLDPLATTRGELRVVAKHVTALNANVEGFANRVDMYDTPWTLELSSGQFIHGAYWHSRFGIEHGPGNIQLAPADARHVWLWSTPNVPEGWHALVDIQDAEATIVNVRK
jgi:hypothetical protein